MKKQKILTHFTIAMLLLIGVFGILQAEGMKTEEYPKEGKIDSGSELGKFQSIELLKGLRLGYYKVKAKFNENPKPYEKQVDLESSNEGRRAPHVSIPGGTQINRIRIMVEDLLRRETIIDSGDIELDWIKKDPASVFQNLMDKLKEKGINTSITRRNDVLVISIEDIQNPAFKTKE